MLLTSVVKPVRADPVAKSDEPSAAKTSPLRLLIATAAAELLSVDILLIAKIEALLPCETEARLT